MLGFSVPASPPDERDSPTIKTEETAVLSSVTAHLAERSVKFPRASSDQRDASHADLLQTIHAPNAPAPGLGLGAGLADTAAAAELKGYGLGPQAAEGLHDSPQSFPPSHGFAPPSRRMNGDTGDVNRRQRRVFERGQIPTTFRSGALLPRLLSA